MSDYQTHEPHPDDAPILLDSRENRRHADAELASIGAFCSLGATTDPLSLLSDEQIDDYAAQGVEAARVSQVVRRCQREIEDRYATDRCPLPRPASYAVGWRHRYYAAAYPNAAELNAWAFWPLKADAWEQRQALGNMVAWAVSDLRWAIRKEGREL